MANLIIKPTSGGSLILQDEGGTAAHTIDANGNTTLAGTTNNLGTVTAGSIAGGSITSATTFPAGHVVRTTQVNVNTQSGTHISTTSQTPVASGIILTTPATTGSNYNVITWSGNSYTYADQDCDIFLYVNKNGGGYAQATGGGESGGIHSDNSEHRRSNMMWIDDQSGLTAGNNLYQLYIQTDTGTFYLVHINYDYNFMVQEIQA